MLKLRADIKEVVKNLLAKEVITTPSHLVRLVTVCISIYLPTKGELLDQEKLVDIVNEKEGMLKSPSTIVDDKEFINKVLAILLMSDKYEYKSVVALFDWSDIPDFNMLDLSTPRDVFEDTKELNANFSIVKATTVFNNTYLKVTADKLDTDADSLRHALYGINIKERFMSRRVCSVYGINPVDAKYTTVVNDIIFYLIGHDAPLNDSGIIYYEPKSELLDNHRIPNVLGMLINLPKLESIITKQVVADIKFSCNANDITPRGSLKVKVQEKVTSLILNTLFDPMGLQLGHRINLIGGPLFMRKLYSDLFKVIERYAS